jgi:hypothetical protein
MPAASWLHSIRNTIMSKSVVGSYARWVGVGAAAGATYGSFRGAYDGKGSAFKGAAYGAAIAGGARGIRQLSSMSGGFDRAFSKMSSGITAQRDLLAMNMLSETKTVAPRGRAGMRSSYYPPGGNVGKAVIGGAL